MASVDIPLDLETRCWSCDATGTPPANGYVNSAGKCGMCEGVGYVPTDLGEAVLRFVRRHAKATEQ